MDRVAVRCGAASGAGEPSPLSIALILMLTDESVRAAERILKKSEKVGLYVAMDLAHVWLERALEEYGEFIPAKES